MDELRELADRETSMMASPPRLEEDCSEATDDTLTSMAAVSGK